jgi:hypothetical protein
MEAPLRARKAPPFSAAQPRLGVRRLAAAFGECLKISPNAGPSRRGAPAERSPPRERWGTGRTEKFEPRSGDIKNDERGGYVAAPRLGSLWSLDKPTAHAVGYDLSALRASKTARLEMLVREPQQGSRTPSRGCSRLISAAPRLHVRPPVDEKHDSRGGAETRRRGGSVQPLSKVQCRNAPFPERRGPMPMSSIPPSRAVHSKA